MASLINIRFHTITKAVPEEEAITLASVMVDNGTLMVKYTEGPCYILGSVSTDDYTMMPPLEPQCPCGENTTNSNVLATLLKGVDGITPDMSDYYDKNIVEQKLSQKQNVIPDLSRIRTDASLGATALQSVPSEYITESELQNKGYLTAIPREYVTEDELLSKGYATVSQVNAKQDIISDLDTIRRNAIKGATALRPSDVDSEVLETSTNPVQNKAVAGALNEIVGLLDATLSSVGERFNSKQDKLVSGENIKTINGESIIGEGNITIEGGGSADLTGYATEEYVDNAVAEVNVKGEDGYVYSSGEKVDMRIRRSLIPIGTLIPAKANLNTIAYLKVGNYYCSQTANAKTITNCPVEVAFSMEVFNPLSETLDDETTSTYTYRIRKITAYNTGVQYIQYCNTSGTAGTWTYGSWYVVPRTSFSLASDKNGGSAVKGGSNRGVYIDASGTFQQMGYTIAKSVPSNAVFTDTNTKVTAVDNHYAPAEDVDATINAPEGEVVVGLKRDAAGHVVGVMSTPMSSGGGGGGGGITVETDPIFSASPAATITENDKVAWSGKQDVISDIATIREGAAKGATAVQPSDLSDVATSGSYNDLLDKPTIPSAINIAGINYTPSGGGIIDLNPASLYRKPSDGIPAGDFSREVQLSLINADAYKGTVTGVKINGTTKFPSNGVVDLGNIPTSIPSEVYIADFDVLSLESLVQNGEEGIVIDKQGLMDALARHKVILVPYEISDNVTAKGYCTLVGYYEDLLYIKVIAEYKEIIVETSLNYPDIYGQEVTLRRWADKQDVLKSGENIKTINGESLLGSGDITISGGGGVSGSAQLPANYISSNIAQACLIPSGMVTIFSMPQTEGVTMRLSTVGMESGKDNAWVIRFSIGADNTGSYVVESEDNFSIKWANGIAPTFENGKYYEMSFRLIGTMFLGVWASFE